MGVITIMIPIGVRAGRTRGLGPILAAAVLLVASMAATARARAPESARAHPILERDILPLLKARCVKCHGPIKPKGKLNLSNPRSMARGGSSGPVVEPGKPEESTLWDLVAGDEMPPKPEDPLSAVEKETLRRWIEQGAAGLPGPAQVASTNPQADHWAFATAARPAPPPVRDAQHIRTPVDRFIQQALEGRGLALGPVADRATLIRRLSFDLTGLPPTPDEIAAFLDDDRPDAYFHLVDRLLASPRYGQRWGKHWLDASGYADSNGYFSADTDRPLAHRYRDYVIRAFNNDRPLDQIVREQLAGDELAGPHRGPGTPPEAIEQLVATHFLRNSQDGTGESDGNPDEVRADKYAVLEGTIQVIGSSLLGLTLQCAKCHDHKFEPVTQKDYYQLQAILYPAFNIEHWLKPNERVVVAGPYHELSRWEAHDKAIDAEIAALKRTFASGPEGVKKQVEEALKPVIQAIEHRRGPSPGQIAWVGDVSADPAEIPVLIRGNLATPGPKIGPGVPAFLTDPNNRYEPGPPWAGSSSTGRRLALARWLTRPGSRPAALLARVLANRIWQHHFGTGLAATSDNLGYTGTPPTHPELLEFLAAELVRSGWSAKALHRLIVTSAVYRQSSAPRPEAARVDPDNRLLARYPLRRLDAESIRDAMLAASGELDDRPGGPYVPTKHADSGEVVVPESTPGAHRRSIYLQQRRTQLASLLDVFDAPSIVTTCTRRLPSTIPLQSLSLLNSDFVVARARRLAERIERDCCDRGETPARAWCGRTPPGPPFVRGGKGAGERSSVSPPAQGGASVSPPYEGGARGGSARGHTDERDPLINRAFLLVTGRGPSREERDASRRFLETQPARYPALPYADARRRAWADFCQMLLASDAFLYVE